MGFRMIAPKRVKKVRSINGQEVLKRLEKYLEENSEEPIEILCGFWEDQRNAISYQELRQMVRDGEINQETLSLWMQDYSILVSGRLNNLWSNAIKAGSGSQPLLDGIAFEFFETPGIMNWIRERGAEFVTACTEEQKNAIAALLTKKMRDSHTVDELARMIRPCIGLTEGDAKATMRLYDSIVSNYRKEHPRMKLESIQRKATDAAQKYAERKHRARALTIAQTESAFAYNRGADDGVRQAQEQGLLGKMKKRWNTSGDDGVCKLCASLEGMEVDMEADFDIKGRLLFVGQHMLPPAHPRCACAVEYIEVEKPMETTSVQNLGAASSSDMKEPVQMIEIGEIEIGKMDEAIAYYNDVIRNRDIETAVVIDRTGKVFYATGDAGGITFSGVNLSGAYLTHNHPISNGILSFGEDDFNFLKEHQDMACFYCVNQEYDYSINVLKDISNVIYNDIYIAAFSKYYEGFDLQHETMEILKERGYVCYVRKKHIAGKAEKD